MLRELQEVALALNSHVGFFRQAATAGQFVGIHNRCIVQKMSIALASCILSSEYRLCVQQYHVAGLPARGLDTPGQHFGSGRDSR
jgi:hypothetical protein